MENLVADSTRRDRLVRYAPLVIWTALIFFLSSSQGSMQQTSRFIRPLLEFLFPNAPEATLIIYHGIIRKMAHFGEYAVLGFLASRAIAGNFRTPALRLWPIYSLFIVLAVAGIDEVNQSFNSTRTGAFGDVLIDCAGGLLAIFICWLIPRTRKI